MSKHKFNIGDKVVYDGLIATVESQSTYAISGDPCYGLVSDENLELSCTGDEKLCERYDGETFDQSGRLETASLESDLIAMKVDNITDKYFRDGEH